MDIPLAGKDKRADAPPDIRQITRSSLVKLLVKDSNRSAPLTPASSGTGWDASIISIFLLNKYFDDILFVTIMSMIITYFCAFIVSIYLSFKVTHKIN